MKGTRNGKTQVPLSPLDILESTAGDSDGLGYTWGDVDPSTLRQLVDEVSRSGGIVTLGAARDDGGIYCSVRFGDSKRAWTLANNEQFTAVVKPVIDACKRSRLRAISDE